MNKEILRLAIPNIISNISVPLISTVDTILMGNLSAKHLGAIGLGAMIFNFIYWNFGFLRMGTTGMTAQAYGAKDNNEATNTLYRACLVALSIAFLLLLFSPLLLKGGILAMQVQSSQVSMVETYFNVRMKEAPATLLLYALLGWFFGMQDAIRPLIITVVVNLLNIGLSIYFVKYLGMEVEGVALGTVLAQYFGVILAVIFLILKYKGYLKMQLNSILERVKLLRFFSVNKDIFLRTICLSTAFFFFYSQSSQGGEIMLAINVILLQFLNWMSYGIDGLAFASESLVGKYTGAKSEKKAYQAIRYVFAWSLGFASLYALVYGICFDKLIVLFNDEPQVLLQAKDYLIWTILLPLIAFACYIWDGIYVGLTASKTMRNTMFLALVVYIGVYYSLQTQFPNHAIWIALFIFLGMRGILMTYYFRKYGLKVT